VNLLRRPRGRIAVDRRTRWHLPRQRLTGLGTITRSENLGMTISVEYYPSGARTLAFLEPSLRKMGDVVDRYIDHFQQMLPEAEIPYKYDERATLSQFAGGIWQAAEDNLVLEEYVCDKACPGGLYPGRGDIWFCAQGVPCYAEAKPAWPSIPVRPNHITCSLKLLRESCDSATSNSAQDRIEGFTRFPLGIVFAVATVKKNTWLTRKTNWSHSARKCTQKLTNL
jgi:hypothetical protein